MCRVVISCISIVFIVSAYARARMPRVILSGEIVPEAAYLASNFRVFCIFVKAYTVTSVVLRAVPFIVEGHTDGFCQEFCQIKYFDILLIASYIESLAINKFSLRL